MKKKVLILGGGISKERLISLETARAVYKALIKKNYKVIICEPDGNLTNKLFLMLCTDNLEKMVIFKQY